MPFTTRIEQGNPAEAVLKCATELPADVIVMGSHGRGGFERLILGSVAEKVLHHASCPVLTVPPKSATPARLPFMRLLCAVDFSDPSLQALHVALSMAEESDAELIVLHAIEWPDDETFLAESLDTPDIRRHLEQRALERLDALIPDEERVWCRPSAKVAVGRAYRQIVSEANAVRSLCCNGAYQSVIPIVCPFALKPTGASYPAENSDGANGGMPLMTGIAGLASVLDAPVVTTPSGRSRRGSGLRGRPRRTATESHRRRR